MAASLVKGQKISLKKSQSEIGKSCDGTWMECRQNKRIYGFWRRKLGKYSP